MACMVDHFEESLDWVTAMTQEVRGRQEDIVVWYVEAVAVGDDCWEHWRISVKDCNAILVFAVTVEDFHLLLASVTRLPAL